VDFFSRTARSDHDIEESIDPNLIIPEIKCKEYLDNISLQADGTHPVYSELIAGDIYLVYTLHLDRQISFLSASDLETAGLLNEGLHNLAISNLKKMQKEIRLYGKAPLFIIASEGVSASSLLLADSIWEQQKENVPGDIIACVPSRDYLLFTGSEYPDGIAKLIEEANEIAESETYLISETLLIRKDGKWVLYDN